ncbi:NAD(P)/FAD-dependent oxidoreductase [Cochlodiniinecator piscidefendens]|uniref:NAD(P)/FAD-dependent oxidoreductase n=1 Tax=Cochlodiniinecator piscidefendens TaxID=2715756 RepID=UPI00140DFB75|nr:FAD-binding oxidoreductase [Cochlodiniinecator piscidefendens]
MLQPSVIPKHTDSNGWWHILQSGPPPKVLNGRKSARNVVVGAGVCGIATAFRLGELCPDDKTILIDAERAGFGASGRNAGFMLNVHSHGPPKRIDILKRNMKLWASGLSDLRNRVEKFQIQCDWSEAGRFYGAAGPDGEKHIDEIAQTLEQLDLERTWLDADQMESRIGTRFYSRGLHTPGNALVNPAALMRGCAQHLPLNVELFEDSPVTEVEKIASGGYVVKTPEGEIYCDRVVLAAGVFLRHFGIGKGRIVPMATYGSLTAPLNNAQLAQLGTGEAFGLLGGSEYGATIRLTEDKRLFVRNYFHHTPNGPVSGKTVSGPIADLHRKSLRARWPELANLPFEHSWGGIMAFTWNDGSIFGEIQPGLFAVLTNDVSPMTRGTASGRLLADLMEGHDSQLLDLQLSLPEARRLPPRPFLDLGIAFQRAKLHFAARDEF